MRPSEVMRIARKTKNAYSGNCPVIIVQHSTKTLSPLDHTGVASMARFGAEELIVQTLMVALVVVMRHELGNRFS
jgi:hypothetical protein